MSKPSAIIYLTGSELTRGETADTNGPYLARELTMLGVHVQELRLVPDDPALLEDGFRDAMAAADIVVVSGGLGPTADDHTIAVLASVLGKKIYEHPEARERMRQRVLRRVGSEDRIPPNYFKQSEVVEGAEVLLNPVGLAPGCLVNTERGFLVTLPGVPRELRALFREEVLPRILERFALPEPRILRVKIMSIGESWAESRIQKLGVDFSRIEYGISARPGELLVKFMSHRPQEHAYLDEVLGLLSSEFSESLIVMPEGLLDSQGDPHRLEISRLVHELLIGEHFSVATAESCTGGLIARQLTDHAGSSHYFRGSIVAYSNDVKESRLEVPHELLERHGAVSHEVCEAMTRSAKRLFDADYAIGVTGIAGPEGGSEEKPVGTVYIGIAYPDARGKEPRIEKHHFWGDRGPIREQTATRALDLIRRDLEA